MKNIERHSANIQNIKYFFSLVLEEYFGDKEELMNMADIDEKDLNNFFNS